MNKTKLVSITLLLCSSMAFARPKTEGNIAKIKPKQLTTVNVYSPLATGEGIQGGEFGQALQKKFNVQMALVSSAEQADIIIWDDLEQYRAACVQNKLLPWEKDNLLSKWAPNIQNNMKRALQKNRFLDSPDRRLYGFGQKVGYAKEIKSVPYSWSIRTDLYEEIGKTDMETLSDLTDVFSKMKEICPFDENGNPYFAMLFTSVDDLVKAYYGYDSFDFGYYDSETGNFYDLFQSDGPYLECLKFLNRLNQLQLLATEKKDAQNVFLKLSADLDVAEAPASGAAFSTFEGAPNKARPIAYCQDPYGQKEIWTIGADSKNAELCLAIINWFSLPEGIEALSDDSCKMEIFTIDPECENIQFKKEDVSKINLNKCYVSLFIKEKPTADMTEKQAELEACIKTQSRAAVFAKDDEEYEKAVSKMQEAANNADYSLWTEYSKNQAKNRFNAEKML